MSRVAGVTTHVIVTIVFTRVLFGHGHWPCHGPHCTHRHYLQSALIMDAQLDVASTSDDDERELLEATNSNLYWDHVIASNHDPHRHPPNALSDQDDDM